MKSLMFAGLLVFAAGNLPAADTNDNKSLEGDWMPVKAELGGKPIPDAVLKSISLKLANGIYDVSVAGQPDKGTYEVDSSSSPKGMTIKGTEGPNKGKTIPAIYNRAGNTLSICYDLSGAQRPKDFKSQSGTRLYLVTYQLKK